MKKINTVLILASFIFSIVFIPASVFAGTLSVSSVSNTSYTYPMINFIISARVAPDTEIVFWNSNQSVKSSIWWGTENPVTNQNSIKYSDGKFSENHFVILKGLKPDISYYYVVGISDSINPSFSQTQTFYIPAN